MFVHYFVSINIVDAIHFCTKVILMHIFLLTDGDEEKISTVYAFLIKIKLTVLLTVEICRSFTGFNNFSTCW